MELGTPICIKSFANLMLVYVANFKLVFVFIQVSVGNNTIIHFIETRLQYNWHSNKNADGLVNRLASILVILNQAHRVAWLIRQEKILK